MKLPLPQGFKMPENVKPGEPFEAVATLVVNEDGMVDLTAVNGMKLGESEEPEEGETPPAAGRPPMVMPWDQESPLE